MTAEQKAEHKRLMRAIEDEHDRIAPELASVRLIHEQLIASRGAIDMDIHVNEARRDELTAHVHALRLELAKLKKESQS